MPIVMNKKVGETPLECLNRLRVEKPEFVGVSLTYAGRLDPMADGVLLVLFGEECNRKEEFLGLDKEYVCEILWGFSTDTYDILGKVSKSEVGVGLEKLPSLLQKFVGKSQQEFPPFSSKPVQGKPLHEWAREGRLGEIEMPSKEIEIKSLELLGSDFVDTPELKDKILSRLKLVNGDFRQEEIMSSWQNCFENLVAKEISVSRIRVTCSTGTYIRSLTHELGKMMGSGAIILSLTRTKVGDYEVV